MGIRQRTPPPGDPEYTGPKQFRPSPPPAPPPKCRCGIGWCAQHSEARAVATAPSNASKVTPGKWRACEDGNGDYMITSDEVNFRIAGYMRLADAKLAASAPQLAAFVRQVANLTKDGERPDGGDDDSEEFEMSSDDAVETVHSLIDLARDLRKAGR